MKKVAIGIALALMVAGCGESTNVRNAKAVIASQLRDPESARWTNVREHSGGLVCGEVNGKNAFGAYAGAQRFYFMAGEGHLVPLTGEGDLCAMHEQAINTVAAQDNAAR